MDNGFQGYIRQGVGRRFILCHSNPSTGAIETPDAQPTYRIYGPTGILLSGTTAPNISKTITGASNATPIVITAVAHGFETGNIVTITGVGGNTAANGTKTITKLSADTFSLDGSVGNGSYTSGGTVNSAGAQAIQLQANDAALFTPGETYTIEMSWNVSSSPRMLSATFGCN